jgi:hypothetical protein
VDETGPGSVKTSGAMTTQLAHGPGVAALDRLSCLGLQDSSGRWDRYLGKMALHMWGNSWGRVVPGSLSAVLGTPYGVTLELRR